MDGPWAVWRRWGGFVTVRRALLLAVSTAVRVVRAPWRTLVPPPFLCPSFACASPARTRARSPRIAASSSNLSFVSLCHFLSRLSFFFLSLSVLRTMARPARASRRVPHAGVLVSVLSHRCPPLGLRESRFVFFLVIVASLFFLSLLLFLREGKRHVACPLQGLAFAPLSAPALDNRHSDPGARRIPAPSSPSRVCSHRVSTFRGTDVQSWTCWILGQQVHPPAPP